MPDAEARHAPLRIFDAVRALAFIGDLSMGQPTDHSLRTGWLAAQLAHAAGFDASVCDTAREVALLRWSGCTANAAGFAQAFGDDVAIRAAMLENRPGLADAVGRAGAAMIPLAQIHCEVSGEVARILGLSHATETALRHIFESWDGNGLPARLAREQVPAAVSIVTLAGDLDVFSRTYGIEQAIEWIRQRAGARYPGVLNLITASRERGIDAAADWLADSRVRKITFTGSTAVGKLLARDSAATLKKLSLELGGNAPFIVFDDAELDAAVDGLMAAKFRNGGQTCVSPNRIYVQAGVYDAFAAKLAARVAALKVAPATDPAAQIGPMINARAVDKIARHVGDAVERGARVLTGGKRLTELGPNFYAPTVLADASADMQLTCEETFGPVAPLFRFNTEDEAVDAANDTPFGLAAYFYTQDVRRIARVSARLETGIVGINEGALASEAAPFGGVKESGYGREGSRYGLDDYLSIKYLCQGGLD